MVQTKTQLRSECFDLRRQLEVMTARAEAAEADLDRCVNLLLTVQHIQTVPDMNRLARLIQDVQKRIAQRKAVAERTEAQP